jgi:hypothetical protein
VRLSERRPLPSHPIPSPTPTRRWGPEEAGEGRTHEGFRVLFVCQGDDVDLCYHRPRHHHHHHHHHHDYCYLLEYRKHLS